MNRVVCDISVSLDGFVAGPDQRLEQPLGEGASTVLHRWMFEQPEQNAAELELMRSCGAFIMGRNMFGPGRGSWDESWRGWWGETPPYGTPVFVLSHYPREPLEMLGGTTFYFVPDGIVAALDRAREAAGDGIVSIAGGAATANQYLAADLIDELRLHLSPVLLGAGERLFAGLGARSFEQTGCRQTELVTHLTYRLNG